MLRKLLPKGDRWFDRIGSWWAVLGPGGVLWVVMAYASSAVEPIAKYGWGAVALSGVLFACIFMFAASALMAAWRYLRPLPESEHRSTSNPELIQPPLPDWSTNLPDQLHSTQTHLDELNGRLETFSRATVISSQTQEQQREALESELAKVSERIATVEQALEPKVAGLLSGLFAGRDDGTRLGTIETAVEKLQDTTTKALERVDERLGELRHSHHQLHDRVWHTFRAKQAEQRMIYLLERLETSGKALSAPTDDKLSQVDWTKWNKEFKEWQVSLHELCTLAKPYHDVEEALLDTPSETYRGSHWKVDSDARFPDADQVHDYKTFRILLRNLEDHKKAIVDAVRRKAFV